MEEIFKPQQNIKPEKGDGLEVDAFMNFSNTQSLYELVPDLELSSREDFSTLSLETQASIIADVKNKKQKGEKKWEILYYVINAIKAYTELDSVELSDSDDIKREGNEHIN